VHLEQASARPEIGGVHSLLRVSDSNGSDDDMTVHHYLFEQWPDHGVPQGESIVALKQLLKEVHAQRAALGGQDSCELWVHW
jgi:protein tyrosine phosphatase